MAISIADNLARPKLAQTVSVPVSVSVLNPTETDGSDSFVQYIQLDNIQPAAFTETCNATNATPTLTVTSAPHTIRIGDVVTGTGIASSSAVTAVSGNTITLNNNVTAGITGGTITFTPPETDAKLMGIQGNFTVSGTNLTLRLRAFAADGSKTNGPTDSTTVADMGTAVFDTNLRVNLDSFLSSARVARTNS
jgi:hypothetical protein